MQWFRISSMLSVARSEERKLSGEIFKSKLSAVIEAKEDEWILISPEGEATTSKNRDSLSDSKDSIMLQQCADLLGIDDKSEVLENLSLLMTYIEEKPQLERLIWGAIANLKSKQPRVRFALVADAFGIGAGRAIAICRQYGFDPDEEVKR